ncbi:MAG: hypothetical protein IPK59_19085 [Rhodospirillaceae bacterium]|nr:hypothetical protein [Rhodospirillaceae bacterium]
MNKQLTAIAAVASLVGILAFAGHAAAANDRNYTCKKGSITVKSVTPCYVTSYGIRVPGSHKSVESGNKKGDSPKDQQGGFKGPKDLKDKPKGGGFNGKGPQDIKS